MKQPRYIVIEGPIGVGKTTLAEMLARELDTRLVLENVEDNLFLPKFYENPEKFGFQTQIAFLLARFKQQQGLYQQDLFQQNTISDYLFDKDRIFAYINLVENELKLYEEIYALLSGYVVVPDLVVYLAAKTEVLLKRVKKRGLEYEKHIDIEYLKSVNQAYNDFFFYYDEAPLLTVNTSKIDFTGNEEDFQSIVKEIRSMKKGIQHFNPLGSR